MDFVRKVSWRLIALLMLAISVLAFTPRSIISFPTSAESLKQYSLSLASCLFIGFFFRRLTWIRHIDTWLHEFGHATVVVLFGGMPKSIRLNQDSSGVTNFSYSKITPFRDIVISAAGPMASVFTLLLGSMLVVKGLEVVLLAVVGLFIFLLLVSTVRTPFGWVVGILIWASIAFTYSVKLGLIPTLIFPNALDIYLGCFLGLASGVSLRSTFQRIRFHSVHGDEGKIALRLHVPEVVVDWLLVILNAAVVFGVVLYLNVGATVSVVALSYPELQQKLDELIQWFKTIPILN